MKQIHRISCVLFLALIGLSSTIQASVVVPGDTSGGFGNPIDEVNPFIPAFTVTGSISLPITVTISATGCVVDYLLDCVDWKGVPWTELGTQTPMQEAGVVIGYPDNSLDALIAAFVPETTVNDPNFQAVDATKAACNPGPCIDPSLLFYAYRDQGVIVIGEPGTLFFGINDFFVGDNAGSFEVTVSETSDAPEPGTLVLIGGGFAAIGARRFARKLNRG